MRRELHSPGLLNARWLRLGLALSFGALNGLGSHPATAGPPFETDDPVPTDYRNWKIYTGFQYQNQCCGTVSASAPFAEFNYGAMPNVQVSTSLPFERNQMAGSDEFGYGVTEFGIKTRFVQETSASPQISFYPSVEIPSSGGHVVTFLPLWLQKSWGPWTAYGGGGVYLNPGPAGRITAS